MFLPYSFWRTCEGFDGEGDDPWDASGLNFDIFLLSPASFVILCDNAPCIWNLSSLLQFISLYWTCICAQKNNLHDCYQIQIHPMQGKWWNIYWTNPCTSSVQIAAPHIQNGCKYHFSSKTLFPWMFAVLMLSKHHERCHSTMLHLTCFFFRKFRGNFFSSIYSNRDNPDAIIRNWTLMESSLANDLTTALYCSSNYVVVVDYLKITLLNQFKVTMHLFIFHFY
jgi:hypothetical protein